MKQLLFLLILTSGTFSQGIHINELMSSNGNTIQDEDGDTPDWIELYNGNDSIIHLLNYGISDDPDNLYKWIFPDISLLPNDYLLIFASDKDRHELVHWETIIDWGDEWQYFIGDSEPPSDWNTSEFDASNWLTGPSGFGYGDNDDSTYITPTVSIYTRNHFYIENPEDIIRSFLHIDYDDAFVAYINGIEIARANIGEPGIPPPYNLGADTWREAEMYQGGFPEPFEINLNDNVLISGINTLAIQCHNYDIHSSDLSLIPFLTLGFDSTLFNSNETPELVVLPETSLHTNFKISSSGEILSFTSPTGEIIDQIETGFIPRDFSIGRQPDGSSSWLMFNEPTPGSSNITEGFEGILEIPHVSPSGGFFNDPIQVEIIIDSPSAIIYYTTDSTEPDESSSVYSGPIELNSTTIIRARAFDSGWAPSKIITHTFFQNVDHSIPIISLTTAPDNLWDEETGIYVMGNNASNDYPYFGANFWEDWERPIHIELFESNEEANLRMDAGVKIFGGWSRGFPQKSLSIFARSTYGFNEIEYNLFPDRPFSTYEAFVLRNSGNDWSSTMMRDGLLTGIVRDTDLDLQAYRPVVVYLNGEYWGIHNMREKINEHFIASHHNIPSNNIDLLEFNGIPIVGDSDHYMNLLQYISTHDLSMAEHYNYVQTQMDVENFISYYIAQIYFDNRDWPGNNIKFWRPKTSDGKWKWILYDTDFGFGIWDPYAYSFNTLQFAAEPNGPDWPNPPWSTFLFRALLENESFQLDFINHFCDHLNTTFNSDEVLELSNQLSDIISTEMDHHIEKWDNIYNWNNNINRMNTFASYRVPYVRTHIQSFFNLEEMALLQLSSSPDSGGSVQLNSVAISEFPFQGHYFKSIPITLTAIPALGFEFVGWSGVENTDSSQITFSLQNDISIQAMFEPIHEGNIVINEINYNSSSNFDTEDWVELFNGRNSTIDLENWKFLDSDDNHTFIFPETTQLEPGDFLVLCRDTSAFRSLFPNVTHIIGNFDFGLSGGGELIRLVNNLDELIDFVEYDDNSPWPSNPDGDGPTLELINPSLDNSIFSSWASSSSHGTPGQQNSAYQELSLKDNPILPRDIVLYPTYPNPFNPTTTLSFFTPIEKKVSLQIYNIQGQLVETLINNRIISGEHRVQWIPTHISSGIYFAQLKLGKKVINQKLTYLK